MKMVVLWLLFCVLYGSSAVLSSTSTSTFYRHKVKSSIIANGHLTSAQYKKHAFFSQHPFGVLSNCSTHYITQYLDHFNFRAAPNGQTTYSERYFVCGGQNWKPNSTIFFYTGNEADVELYVNNTGLMWENADSFEAIMVFAEHRFFGKSLPFDAKLELNNDFLAYLSADQAMADYAYLIRFLKSSWNSWSSPIIGFGGSYGGMLCTWFRIKYPQWMDGCIAGSAPVSSFMGQQPQLNYNYFADGETYDCTIKGGLSSDNCATNIQRSWNIIFESAFSIAGRQELADAFRLCRVPLTETEGVDVAYWVSNALGFLTMGSYPYPSSYMTNGGALLPAYPMRLGCNSYLNQTFANDHNGNYSLLTQIRNVVGIFYNSTLDIQCFDLNANANNETQLDGELWNYLYCTEIFQPFGQMGGLSDMFWYAPWNATEASLSCFEQYQIYPRQTWAVINYGAGSIGAAGVSNIVFSNGELDPWKGGGITSNLSASLTAIIIPAAGHHIDLMFSNPKDTPQIQNARQYELDQIRKWVNSKNKQEQEKQNKF